MRVLGVRISGRGNDAELDFASGACRASAEGLLGSIGLAARPVIEGLASEAGRDDFVRAVVGLELTSGALPILTPSLVRFDRTEPEVTV